MQLVQTILERHFTIKHKGKTYYVDYINSNRPCLALLNRFKWKVLDEDLEEIDVYYTSEEEKKQINENCKLVEELIDFCIKHFNNFKPNYKRN